MHIEDSEPQCDQVVEASHDKRINNYIDRGGQDEWTVRTARRIFAEDAEFYRLLGDR